MYLVRSAWFSQRDSGYFPLRCSVKIIRSTGGTLTGIQKTHTWSIKKQWKCHKKTCKGSPTPKLGGEMSSSRVASIRYHSNYPCALPCNVSFTRHTTSFLRWISHLWMAIHFMTRQPSEVIPWKGRLKNIYIKTGKNNPFPIESITQQGSSPPCCNYTILPNMSKLDPKNSLLPTCSPSSCRESGGSKWNKHFPNPAGVDLYTCWNFWCCPWLLIDFHTMKHDGEPTPSTEISCQRGSSIHANSQVWHGFSNITWKPMI